MGIRTLRLLLLTTGLSACALVGTDEGNRDGTCGQHSSCPSDQACGSGNCVDMLGRSYVVSAIELEVCDTNLDGEAFDSLDGTPPDPTVELRFGGSVIFTSGIHDDTLMTTFTVPDEEVVITDFNDSFVLEVSDNDLVVNELMDTISIDVGYVGLRAGEVVEVNQSDCTESPVLRAAVVLKPTDGAW